MSTRAQVRFATRETGVSFNEHPKKIHACTTKQGVKVYAIWYDEQINNK